MKKEKYEKPAIDAFELDDDIILASGCVDVLCADVCNVNCGGPECDQQQE